MNTLIASVLAACEDRIADQFAASTDAAIVRDALEAELPGLLQNTLARVYVYKFHQFREHLGLPVDAESTKAIETFHDQLTGRTIQSWFDEYPVLERLITTIVTRRVAELDRVASAIRADLGDGSLVGAGLISGEHGAVERIRGLGSDLHNGGRVVCRVDLESGESVIYKPRPLGIEQVGIRVFGEVAEASGIDVSRTVPPSIDRGEYGWQQFLTPSPLNGRDDAGAYFRKLGVVAAVLGVLGSVDMHHENVFACGDTPVLIDLETLLHAEKAIAETNVANSLVAWLKRSPVNTMLLPQRVPSGPYSVLIAGVGVPTDQMSERNDFVVVNPDTDAVDIARRRFDYQQTDNIPRDHDGNRYSAVECADEFMDGFERGYRACVDRAPQLREALSVSVPVRHVLRSTAIYYRVFSAATHPDYLQDEDEFERLLSMLGSPSGLDSRGESAFVRGEEMVALKSGDIPHFTVASGDIRLQGSDGLSPVIFDVSPSGRAVRGLRDAPSDGIDLARYLVEVGLDELGRAVGRPPELSRRTFDDALVDGGVSWREVVARLKLVAVRTRGVEGDEVAWISAGHGDGTGTFEAGTSISLHDSGGIEILFSRMAAGRPDDTDPAFTAAVRRGVDWLALRFRDVLRVNLHSIASGPASLAYMRSATSSRSLELEALAEEALSVEPDRSVDVLGGVPGYGLALAAYPDTPPDLLARLLKVTDEAIDGPHGPEREAWNLAHGELGLVWALHRIAVRLGDDDTAGRAADRFERILDAAVDVPHGWCCGLAGLVMVGGEVLPDGGGRRVDELAERMTSLKSDALVDLSVCHGVAGVVQTLIGHARRSRQDWPLELAADHMRDASSAAKAGYVTGTEGRTNFPGYFLGWSGVADSALMLELAREGRSPWLPIAFAPAVDGGLA